MYKKYLALLSQKFPTIDSVISEGCNGCINAKRERDFLLTLPDKTEIALNLFQCSLSNRSIL